VNVTDILRVGQGDERILVTLKPIRKLLRSYALYSEVRRNNGGTKGALTFCTNYYGDEPNEFLSRVL